MKPHALGELSDETRLPLPESAEPWWDYLVVAFKDWEKAAGRLPDSITHLLIPLVLDAAVRFRDADFTSTTNGRAIRKRMLGERIPKPDRGIVDQTVLTVVRTWAGGTPLKLIHEGRDPYVPLTEFVTSALHEGRPVTLLSTPTHRFGWIDPVTFVERLLGCRAIESEVCEMDWALALLRLSFHRREEALAIWNASRPADDAINSYVQVALNPDFQPAHATGDPRLLVAAMRARSPDEVISKHWPWAHGLEGHGTHDPVDFSWTFPTELKPGFPEVKLTIVDHAGLSGKIVPEVLRHFDEEVEPDDESWGELRSLVDIARRVAAKRALAIEKRMPADALPPVSLYRGLTKYWDVSYDGPGVPPQSGSVLSLWPASPDIFWTRWAMDAVRRDQERFGNMTLPEYCLQPLDQPDQPVTRTAIRWLWFGWNNREKRFHTAALRRTVDLIRQARLESDAVVDVFESMNPCDWWHPMRLRKAFIAMVEMLPESASFFGNVIGRCVAAFPAETRGLRQLATLGAGWQGQP